MTVSPEKNAHPDAAFVGKRPPEARPPEARPLETRRTTRSATAGVSLTQTVAALAVSLGTTVPDDESYDPDPFVVAVQRRHDELAEVADKLRKQNEEQRKLALELTAREAAVAAREKRVAAFEKLQEVSSAKSWRFW